MTMFDDKEKAAENKYAHDQEMRFRVNARARRLTGLWAAEMLGLSGNDAHDYAQGFEADLMRNQPQKIFEKIKRDFADKQVTMSDYEIHEKICEIEQIAHQQVVG